MVTFTQSSQTDSSQYLRLTNQSVRAGYDMMDCETISILGADCPLGKQITEISLRCGYKVQALIQTPLEQSPNQNLHVLQSESFEDRHVQTVVQGSTCVINLCNLSSDDTANGSRSSASISEAGLHAIQKSGARRYLLVTHPSVRAHGDRKLISDGFASRYLWPVAHRRRSQEMQQEVNLVMNSMLNWTIIRCPKIEDFGGYGAVSVNRNKPIGRFVAMDRLARYLVHLKDSDNYSRQAIFVASLPVRTF